MIRHILNYETYFKPGARIRIGIPVTGGEVFREWGIISTLELNVLSLRLSRRILPEYAQIGIGAILELQVGKEGVSYYCRGIVISEYDDDNLLLELISEIITTELREYFRIDAFLPLAFSVPAEQNPLRVKEKWTAQRVLRRQQELSAEQRPGLVQQRLAAPPTTDWDQVMPISANISGGGIRTRINERLRYGDLLNLEIYLPLFRPKILTVVGRVVYANPVVLESGAEILHDTAMHFLFIDERERDQIINYISEVELKRIREFKNNPLRQVQSANNSQAIPRFNWERLALRSFYLLILAVTSFYLINGLINYRNNRQKGEIEKTFEDSIKKYSDKVNKNR